MRFPRAQRYTALPGGSGIVPAGIKTGEPGAGLSAIDGAGNARSLSFARSAAWAESKHSVARQEPRWSAGRRAGFRKARIRARARWDGNAPTCGVDKWLVRLSALRLPHFGRSLLLTVQQNSDANKKRAARTGSLIFTRASGGGGPPEARVASAGWWRGRLTRRAAFVERISLRPTPLPPNLRALCALRMVRLPRIRGAG